VITLGIVLVLVAAVLIVLGLAWSAAYVLLWLGIGLLVVGAVLWVFGYRGRAGGPPVV
jgi:hypothetical protein